MTDQPKKIYIVTAGEYSDYGIIAPFSSKQLAEKFIESCKWSEWDCPRIEEYYIDRFGGSISKGHTPYFVQMKRNGDIVKVDQANSTYFMKTEKVCKINIVGELYTYCYAKDAHHAIKIANERRTQLIATNQWPNE